MKQRRGIRRFIIRAGIFLLLGATVSIAVAWVCALVSEPNFDLLRRAVDGDEEFTLEATDDAWFHAKTWNPRLQAHSHVWTFSFEPGPVLTGFGFRSQTVTEYGGVTTPGMDSVWIRDVARFDSAGWPTLGLATRAWNVGPQLQRGADQWIVDDGIAWREPQRKMIPQRYLPLRPIWPGFAINTLFYAAILWLLFALPEALRRWRRIKRGLCPACAYPVGASDLCTECGKPVTATTLLANT